MTPHMHFMVRDVEKSGWIAPVEQQSEYGPGGGTYVVPIAENGWFSKYLVDFARYIGEGQRGPTETTEAIMGQSHGKNLLVFEVDGQSIVFQERHPTTRLKYVGQLTHPDFDFVLAEFEPEDSLDEFLARTGYIVLGYLKVD